MTKRIDTHAHLGECCVFGLLATEEDILRRMDECKVDATIIQPYPGPIGPDGGPVDPTPIQPPVGS